jgi:hypothetical protein
VFICNGAAGAAGPAGDAGTPGTNGLSPTVTAIGTLGEAGNCVGVGGVKIQVGTGTPVYACNGAAGAAGPAGDAGTPGESATVTEVPFEGEAGNCECRGGAKIQVGTGSPVYVCNAEAGFHNGGAGTCVPVGTCSSGYHDGGSGTCVALGSCSSGYHDGGDGTCVAVGTCVSGYAGTVCVPVVEVLGGSSTSGNWSFAGGSVTVATFKMDKTEVTVTQYAACVAAGVCPTPTNSCTGWGVPGEENHPFTCVTWYRADEYCTWAGKRLPTEIEWQWAASNRDTTVYPWGATTPDDTHANWSGVTPKSTRVAVGSYPKDSTAAGVLDMAGNVVEWTASDHTVGGTTKALRSAAWYVTSSNALRAAFRANSEAPQYGVYNVGFRCVQ